LVVSEVPEVIWSMCKDVDGLIYDELLCRNMPLRVLHRESDRR
jgi:hypothetical protein